MITKEQLILDNKKNDKILSLMEEVEDIQQSYQEKDEEYDLLKIEKIELENMLWLYKKEFWEYIECDCNWLNKECMICKWKWFYFNKQK